MKRAPAAEGATEEEAQKKPKAEAEGGGRHWLLKSEPDCFGIDHLIAAPGSTAPWDGVRNLEARGALREMAKGNRAFFYHSSCKEPAVVGEVEIVRTHYPDPTQFDKKSEYYDAHSKPDAPKWSAVDVRFVRKLKRPVTLTELKQHKAGPLADFKLLIRQRLSVVPVEQKHWDFILALENGSAK